MKGKRRGEVALFSAALLYGFFGVLSKLINFQIPIFYQSWVRNVLSFIVLGILVVYLKKWKKVQKKDYIWFFLTNFFGFISFITIFIAFTGLDIGTTYFLSYAATILAGYFLGITVFKEKLTKRAAACFALALAGLLLVYRVDVKTSALYFAILAIISGLASPGWSALSKKVSNNYSVLQISFIGTVLAWFFPFVSSILVHEQWVPITFSPVWLYTFLFGLMFLFTAFLIFYGFRTVSAQAGTIILLFEIVAGIIFGYIFFRETPSLAGYIGGALIFAAIVLQSTDKEHQV